MKRPLPDGVRGSIAQARAALAKPEPEPVKDQAELVGGAEQWRQEFNAPIVGRLRCEDCAAEIAATQPMVDQVRNESPVFHDGCEFGRGFGIWRVVTEEVEGE